MTNALLAQFIPEARELLERAGSGMLALEKSPGAESLDDVFGRCTPSRARPACSRSRR